jgi:hypothetical protein
MALDWLAIADLVASMATAIGVFVAARQLNVSKQLAQTGFEDQLSRDYRELVRQLPVKALLGEELADEEHTASLDKFFSYVDLSNEQIFLRQSGRIGEVTWQNWCDGIRHNLSRPAFRRAWEEIKLRSADSFTELRRLESTEFLDPARWPEISTPSTAKYLPPA